MFKRGCLAGLVMLLGLVSGRPAVAAASVCGDVSIASMNWASAEVIAEIDRRVLSAGYGCNVEFQGGDALPLLQSMAQTGKPDLVPELWISGVMPQYDSAAAGGRIVQAVDVLVEGAEEGFWIPRYVADANPEIKTLGDALARPDLFTGFDDAESDTGLIHNCPPDWPCHVATGNLFRAFEAEQKGFTLVNTGSAAGLDASIAKAYEQELGWLGYYWAPTALLGRYDMVKLDMGEHDQAQWHECIVDAECSDPAVNSWPANPVLSIMSERFASTAGPAVQYLSSRQWGNPTVNELLAWMSENQATGAEGMVHFLKNFENTWSPWVSAEALEKIKATLTE